MNLVGGGDLDEFEKLLEAECVSVERFVRFRMSSKADADDVLQAKVPKKRLWGLQKLGIGKLPCLQSQVRKYDI